MSRLARFLTRMIFLRFAVILLGLSAFVLTLEVVGFLTDVLRIETNPLVAILAYCAARLPGVLSLFLPISLLLALLLSMTELSYRNELTAIWATGISPARLIIKLLPLALGLGALHFVVMDQAVPTAAPFLRTWGIGDYATRKFDTQGQDPVWIRSGNDLMRAESVSADGNTLTGLTIFKREADGRLNAQIFADDAMRSQGQWVLNNTVTYFASGDQPSRIRQLVYDGPMRLANSQIASPEEMTLSELSGFIANNGFGVRPAYVYQTWWFKRISPVLVALVMVALCVPLGTTFKRGGGLGKIFVAGVVLGFSYFLIDGVAMTMGEIGAVSPWLAALGPALVFGAIALGLLARTDHV